MSRADVDRRARAVSDASRRQPKPIYRCPTCHTHSTAPGRCGCPQPKPMTETAGRWSTTTR